MNTNQIKGNWKQLKGKIKEKWGKLTDNDLAVINGQQEQLVGKLQERYGYSREQAEREIERAPASVVMKVEARWPSLQPWGGRKTAAPLSIEDPIMRDFSLRSLSAVGVLRKRVLRKVRTYPGLSARRGRYRIARAGGGRSLAVDCRESLSLVRKLYARKMVCNWAVPGESCGIALRLLPFNGRNTRSGRKRKPGKMVSAGSGEAAIALQSPAIETARSEETKIRRCDCDSSSWPTRRSRMARRC